MRSTMDRVRARITSEDRLGYRLESESGELRGILSGKTRRAAAHGDAVRPAVGDWVDVDRDGKIVEVVPRKSKLSRKAAGRDAVEQVVAANVDIAFIVTAIEGDLNARRLERYRALCEEGGVTPVIVLTKADLVPDRAPALAVVESAAPGVRVHVTSAVTGEGLEVLDAELRPGLTIALLGSSGVGKSTLVNRWIGETQATADVDDTGRGRHTTTSRALFPTRHGAFLIDTPGMRELGLWEGDLASTFADVETFATQCRFRDCAHDREPGCALREAVESGALSHERVESWRKLRNEILEMERRRAARRKPK
jgi:ribosome biogenesis GTPase / thiamine phosphate phosphatase